MTEVRVFYISPFDPSKYGSYPEDVSLDDFYSNSDRLVFGVPTSLKSLLSDLGFGVKNPSDYFLGVSLTDEGTKFILNKFSHLDPDIILNV